MSDSRRSFLPQIPVITKNLIIINLLVWFASIILPKSLGIDVTKYLGLHYWGASDFNPIQLITYMFMHDTSGFAHIFFNMFSLWMFGPLLEYRLGGKRYLFYYITCGLGAALVQELVWMLTWQDIFAQAIASTQGVPAEEVRQAIAQALAKGENLPMLNELVTVGASGAVFGILLAFGMLFPNIPLYIMFIPIPVKAKWTVIGYGAIELIFGVTGAMSSVAHFAHLGGMLFGFLLIYYWKKKGTLGGGTYV